MNCLECGTVLPGAGASCPNCRRKNLWRHPAVLAGLLGVVVLVALVFAVKSRQRDSDKSRQEAAVRQICEDLGADLRSKPGSEVLSQLGQPLRRAQHKGYEAWVYAAPEGGQFAVYIYNGKVSHVSPDLPAD